MLIVCDGQQMKGANEGFVCVLPESSTSIIFGLLAQEDSLRAMEQELDDDLSVLNLHHVVLFGRIARQLVRLLSHKHRRPHPAPLAYAATIEAGPLCGPCMVQAHGGECASCARMHAEGAMKLQERHA